ncbi:effector-associated constant component EACC1 [Nocardia stercoris]|uniref:effector-associated constant component EACC1 n=1 Tax=Nocardia stercoris TaxID=2483361 RepID=UPI00131A1F2D|nr:hypothetical protein [Nocardia stercoris]
MGGFEITLTGDPDGLPLLAQWMSDEPVAGVVSARISPVPLEPGRMGALSDTLQIAVDTKVDLGAIAASLAVWLRSRRRNLVVEVSGAKGRRKVKVTASGLHSDDSLVETLRTALGEAAD